MEGTFLSISFSRSYYNEEGNEGRNSNESGKIRRYCNIPKDLLTMSSPSILNKREKTTAKVSSTPLSKEKK